MRDKRRQTRSTLVQFVFAAAFGASVFLVACVGALGQTGSNEPDKGIRDVLPNDVASDANKGAYIQTNWKLFLVGTNTYENLDEEFDQRYAVKDVEAIKERFIQLGVPQENITILTSQSRRDLRSTKRNIEVAFRRYIANLNKGDNAFIYLSGHDIRLPNDWNTYYMPLDADLSSESSVIATSVSIDEMVEALQNSVANLRWMTIDASRLDPDFDVSSKSPVSSYAPGAAMAPSRWSRIDNASDPDIEGLSDTLILMQGSKDGQVTIESPELEQGLMAYALLEALQFEDNPADFQQSGELKLSDILGYVQARTEELAQLYLDESNRPAEQSPTFPIFILEDATFLTNLRHGGLSKFQIQLIKAEEEKFLSSLAANDFDRAQNSLATLAEYYPEGKRTTQYKNFKQKLDDAMRDKTDEIPGEVNIETILVQHEADDLYKEALKAFYLKEYESVVFYLDQAIELYDAPEYYDFRNGLFAFTVRAEALRAIADCNVEAAKSMNQVFAKLDPSAAKANETLILKLESNSDSKSAQLPILRTRRVQNHNDRRN